MRIRTTPSDDMEPPPPPLPPPSSSAAALTSLDLYATPAADKAAKYSASSLFNNNVYDAPNARTKTYDYSSSTTSSTYPSYAAPTSHYDLFPTPPSVSSSASAPTLAPPTSSSSSSSSMLAAAAAASVSPWADPHGHHAAAAAASSLATAAHMSSYYPHPAAAHHPAFLSAAAAAHHHHHPTARDFREAAAGAMQVRETETHFSLSYLSHHLITTQLLIITHGKSRARILRLLPMHSPSRLRLIHVQNPEGGKTKEADEGVLQGEKVCGKGSRESLTADEEEEEGKRTHTSFFAMWI